MLINTRHFGEIEVDEEGIIHFEEGLPGFTNYHKFVLLGTEDMESPFRWLQSVEDGNLAFALVSPFAIKPDYDINIDDEYLKALDIQSPSEVLVFAVVVVSQDILKCSMNLKAPVIINIRNKKGAQIILDTDRYGVRHYIADELRKQELTRKQEVAGNVGVDKEERAVYCNK